MKNTTAPVTLMFPDGTEIPAKDATDAIARLGALQWTPLDVPTMKARLADRAWAWNQSVIDADLPDDEFLTALDATTMVAVVWSPHPAKPRPTN